MPDQEARLLITAHDGTAAALKSVQTNFIRTQAELQRGVKTLSDGTKVNLDLIQKAAEKSGLPFKELMKHIEGNAKAAANAGHTLGTMGQQTQRTGGAVNRLSSALGSGAAGMAMMAARTLTVVGALETARRGFMGFAEFEVQLRHVANATGMTAKQFNALGDEMKRLSQITGDSKEDMLSAFEELREAGNFTPEETARMMPDLALAAKGMRTQGKTAGRILGDVMRNLDVPQERYMEILEASSHAAQAFNLDIEKMAPGMSKLMESAAAAGYKGVDGFQRMITTVGVAKEALGDAGEATQVVQRVLEKMGSAELGKALGFAGGKDFDMWLKQQPDRLGSVLDLMKRQTENEYEIMNALGIREIGVWRKLQGALGTYADKLEGVRNAQGAVARGEFITDSPAVAVQKLTNSLTGLIETIGQFLHVIGVTKALQDFAKIISDITWGVTKLIEGLEWILTFGKSGGITGLPKSFAELRYNLTAPTDKHGKRLMEWKEVQAGGDPEKARLAYEKKEKEAAERKKAADAKREADAQKKEEDELIKKYPEGPLAKARRAEEDRAMQRTPPSTPPSTPPPTSVPSVPPPIVHRMSLALEDATKNLLHFSNVVERDQIAIARAGLYNLGAGPARAGTGVPGTSVPGTSVPGTSVPGAGAAVTTTPIAYSPPGTAYGASGDARILKASYRPSGLGPYTGGPGGAAASAAGPGGTGTGYGSGTVLAPPATSGPSTSGPSLPAPEAPPGPGPAPEQPAPEAPPGPGAAPTVRRPGQPAPEAPPGPGEGGLAADRAKFKAEMDANPALREKVLRIAANEQGKHGLGTQAVIESMMNRASMKGRTLAQEAKWTGEGGYYEQGNMGRGALEDPKHKAVLDKSLDAALAGGNVSDYATDNASQALAAKRKRNQEMEHTKDIGGESFFRPGQVSGAGNVRKHAAWMARMQRGAPTPPQGPTAAAGPAPPSAPQGPTAAAGPAPPSAPQGPGPTASLGPPPQAPGPPGTGGGGNMAASMNEAMGMIGMNESRNQKVLGEYMRTGGRSLTGEQNAWCAKFVNAVVTRAGYPGVEGWGAKEFLRWGRQVGGREAIEQGDVFVFDRKGDTRATGSGHVGIGTGKSRTRAGTNELEYEMLQGNTGARDRNPQSGGGQVETSWHTRREIRDVRRGVKPPGAPQTPAPPTAVAGAPAPSQRPTATATPPPGYSEEGYPMPGQPGAEGTRAQARAEDRTQWARNPMMRTLEQRPEDTRWLRTRTLEQRPEDTQGLETRTLEQRPEDTQGGTRGLGMDSIQRERPSVPREEDTQGGTRGLGMDSIQRERPSVPREEDVEVKLKVNDAEAQFARASMRRQADREVREARWNSYSDIGAA